MVEGSVARTMWCTAIIQENSVEGKSYVLWVCAWVARKLLRLFSGGLIPTTGFESLKS